MKEYRYISDDYIDFDDRDIVRWVYINDRKTKYMVTIYGEIISIKKETKKILKPLIDKDGYEHVVIHIDGKKYRRSIHRLVALAFIPNPNNKPEVNHKDGNKSNNNVDNLEWATSKENINHAWDKGFADAKRGSDHPESKYSDKQIHRVCKMLESNKKTMKEISEKTKVSYTVVKQIRNRILWRSISNNYNIDNYNIDSRTRREKEVTKKSYITHQKDI